MKKVFALSIVLAFCLGVVALAQDSPSSDTQKSEKMSGKMVTGTVTRVDSTAKMMTVKDDQGQEHTVYWNDSTKVDGGSPTEGAKVSFSTMEKDGKTWATSIKTTPKY
jgi:Cu/Ag efflux protein CusF